MRTWPTREDAVATIETGYQEWIGTIDHPCAIRYHHLRVVKVGDSHWWARGDEYSETNSLYPHWIGPALWLLHVYQDVDGWKIKRWTPSEKLTRFDCPWALIGYTPVNAIWKSRVKVWNEMVA